MEKNICKINIGKSQGTGFFCKIPFPDLNNMIPVFITNNHIINEELLYKKDEKIKIDIFEETEIKEIDLNNRIKYTNEEYDITIIEIKEEDKIKNYLELDDKIIKHIKMEDNKENILIGYPNIISYECTKKIKEQMEKNICKINIGKSQGTGFFCKIPFPDLNNMLSVFITNNHIINK